MEAWLSLPPSPETVGAVANVIIALGTIVLAWGILIPIRAAAGQQRDSFYATLDRTYFDIQKLLIDHPHLAQTDCSQKTAEQVIQYDAYALMVWNFIETVYDYSVKDKTLAITWNGGLRHEARRHFAWFIKRENRPLFKREFIKFVLTNHLLSGKIAGEKLLIPKIRFFEKIQRVLRPKLKIRS